jgi:hypothetical protein
MGLFVDEQRKFTYIPKQNIGILGKDTSWKGVRPSATEKLERLSVVLDQVIGV